MKRPLFVTVMAIIIGVTGVLQVIFGTEILKITDFGLARVARVEDSIGYGAIFSGALSIIAGALLFTLVRWAWSLAVIVLAVRIVSDAATVASHGVDKPIGTLAVINLVITFVLLLYLQRGNVKAAFGRGAQSGQATTQG